MGLIFGALNFLADLAVNDSSFIGPPIAPEAEAANLAQQLSAEIELNRALRSENVKLRTEKEALYEKGIQLSVHYLRVAEEINALEHAHFTSGKETNDGELTLDEADEAELEDITSTRRRLSDEVRAVLFITVDDEANSKEEEEDKKPTKEQATKKTSKGQATKKTSKGQATKKTSKGQATKKTSKGQATKKSSKKAVATTYSSNAVVNDFVATGIKSNGLVIGGKSYNSQELITLGFAANPAVTVSPMYWQTDGTFTHSDGSVEDTGTGRHCGFYLLSNGVGGFNQYDDREGAEMIYDLDISESELTEMKAFDFAYYCDYATLNTNGVWNTNTFVADGINTQYICSWMQSRGLNTASDVYNYLVANGATFTDDTASLTGDDVTEQLFVCDQCPSLYYSIDTAPSRISSRIYYATNTSGSGVNSFTITSAAFNGCTTWSSGVKY